MSSDGPATKATVALDPKVAKIVEALWRPVRAEADPNLAPVTISQTGRVLGAAWIAAGAETAQELVVGIQFYTFRNPRTPNDPNHPPALKISPEGHVLDYDPYAIDAENELERPYLNWKTRHAT